MKKFIIAALAASVIGVVPASASAPTTSHCDTDNVTYYVTKQGKRAIKVRIDVRGCIEHTIEDGFYVMSAANTGRRSNVTCSRVTMTIVQPSVKFLDNKVKSERRWSKGDTIKKEFNDGCFPISEPLFERKEEWGGRYRYKLNLGRKDWCAFPIVEATVRGTHSPVVDTETITTLRKVGGFAFTKGMNSGSCKFDWDGNGRSTSKPPTMQLPPPAATPPSANGGSDDGGSDGGM